MAHKIVAVNVSHGFQGKYWEIGEPATAQDEEMREDAEGNLIPPPHFKFADGSAKKAKPGASAPKPEKAAEKPAAQPQADKSAKKAAK